MLTVLGDVVLVGLGGLVGGSTSDQLVGEGGVVLLGHTTGLVVVVGIGLVGVVCDGRRVLVIELVEGTEVLTVEPTHCAWM